MRSIWWLVLSIAKPVSSAPSNQHLKSLQRDASVRRILITLEVSFTIFCNSSLSMRDGIPPSLYNLLEKSVDEIAHLRKRAKFSKPATINQMSIVWQIKFSRPRLFPLFAEYFCMQNKWGTPPPYIPQVLTHQGSSLGTGCLQLHSALWSMIQLRIGRPKQLPKFLAPYQYFQYLRDWS